MILFESMLSFWFPEKLTLNVGADSYFRNIKHVGEVLLPKCFFLTTIYKSLSHELELYLSKRAAWRNL